MLNYCGAARSGTAIIIFAVPFGATWGATCTAPLFKRRYFNTRFVAKCILKNSMAKERRSTPTLIHFPLRGGFHISHTQTHSHCRGFVISLGLGHFTEGAFRALLQKAYSNPYLGTLILTWNLTRPDSINVAALCQTETFRAADGKDSRLYYIMYYIYDNHADVISTKTVCKSLGGVCERNE